MAKKSVTETGTVEAKAPAVAEGDWFDASFMELRRQMDRLFDSFGGGWHLPSIAAPFAAPFAAPHLGGGTVSLRFDVSESDDALEVSAELPGMDEKDIEVSLENGLLTVKGEKKAESEQKEKDYYVTERRYGSFRRSFHLPDTVDEDKVQAKFDKGVLRVILPKVAEAGHKARKISISKP
jgi:HSP20 family protein